MFDSAAEMREVELSDPLLPKPIKAQSGAISRREVASATAVSTSMANRSSVQREPKLRLRAPQTHMGVLAVPAMDQSISAARTNAAAIASWNFQIQTRPFDAMRLWARREAAAAAVEYTRRFTSDVELPADDARWYVSGHQPALYHPGVWVKNFLAAALATADRGFSLNLVVDNDAAAAQQILVPVGTATAPQREVFEFDHPRVATPWEETAAPNDLGFRAFGERVTAAMSGWNVHPFMEKFWPAVLQIVDSGTATRTADAFTAARNQTERRWGCRNLELPISLLAETEPFRWFVVHLLARLPEFAAAYNAVLAEYRELHGIRSRTHPVSDLRMDGEWLEAPFWIWKTGAQTRGRLFARHTADGIELSDRNVTLATLPLPENGDACCAVRALEELSANGYRLRPRALMTTLYARLFLADLFIHGIGGAKYDEMTDELIQRCFGVAPPVYQVLTATLHLPLDSQPQAIFDLKRLRRELRDLDYNPQRYLTVDEAAGEDVRRLLSVRSTLLEEHAAMPRDAESRRNRELRLQARKRFLALQGTQRLLSKAAKTRRAELVEQIAAAERISAARSVLRSREYSMTLFPERELVALMDQVVAAVRMPD